MKCSRALWKRRDPFVLPSCFDTPAHGGC